MSKADLPKALERLGQVDNGLSQKFEGAGLKLPLAKQLFELHSGCFDIQSEPGVGKTERFVFPVMRLGKHMDPGASIVPIYKRTSDVPVTPTVTRRSMKFAPRRGGSVRPTCP